MINLSMSNIFNGNTYYFWIRLEELITKYIDIYTILFWKISIFLRSDLGVTNMYVNHEKYLYSNVSNGNIYYFQIWKN